MFSQIVMCGLVIRKTQRSANINMIFVNVYVISSAMVFILRYNPSLSSNLF